MVLWPNPRPDRAHAQAQSLLILISGEGELDRRGKPGEAFTPSAWERSAPALNYFATQDYDKAIEEFERLRAEAPDDPGLLYNLACAESLGGRTADALAHLSRAVELDPDFRRLAEKDSDFDPIRSEPEFASAVAGEPGADGSGA